jgi:glycine cleavage system H protein
MSKTYFLPSHEYIKVDGDYGYIGISEFAAKQLGNVVYVDMPEVGDEVAAGEEFGGIESVKAASDLYSPASGEVVEVNEALEENPRLVNENPLEYWIIKIKLSDPTELDELLDEAAYNEHCANEQH